MCVYVSIYTNAHICVYSYVRYDVWIHTFICTLWCHTRIYIYEHQTLMHHTSAFIRCMHSVHMNIMYEYTCMMHPRLVLIYVNMCMTYMYTDIYLYIYTCIYKRVNMHSASAARWPPSGHMTMYTYMHVSYICICIHIWCRACTCMYVYPYIYIYTYRCRLYIHASIWDYAYTSVYVLVHIYWYM